MRKIPAIVGLRISYQGQLCVITSSDKTAVEIQIGTRHIRLAYNTQVVTESGLSGLLSAYFSSDDAVFFQFEEDLRLIAINILASNDEVLGNSLAAIFQDCVVQYRKIQKSVVHMTRSELRMAKGHDLRLHARIPNAVMSKSELIYMFDKAIVLGPKAMPLDHEFSSLLRRSLVLNQEWEAFAFTEAEVQFLTELGFTPTDIAVFLERGVDEDSLKNWIGNQILHHGNDQEKLDAEKNSSIKRLLRSPAFNENRFLTLWKCGWPLHEVAMVYQSAAHDKYLKNWIDLFDSAQEITQWVDAGFIRPELAKEWMLVGLNPVEASQWYDLDFKNVDEAITWRAASLSVSTCRTLRRSGIEEVEDAKEWMSLCGSIQNFLIIRDDYKISLESLRKLLNSVATVDNLLELLRDGVRIHEIIDWYAPGIESINPDELRRWIKNGFDSSTATRGHELGINPEVADRLRERNFTFEDWTSWIANCGSPEFVEAAIQNLGSRELIEEWLHGNFPVSRMVACANYSLSLSTFKKWNEIGLSDEALIQKWEDSGVPPFVAKVWFQGGVHDVGVAKRWGEYGFVASDALKAISLGFLLPSPVRQVADAQFDGKGTRAISALESLVSRGLTAEVLTRWISAGWRGAGIDSIERVWASDKLLSQWNNSEIDMSEWWDWIPVTSGKAAVAKAWSDAHYSTSEIQELKGKYSISVDDVLLWTKEGLGARDLVRAHQGGMQKPSQWKSFLATQNEKKRSPVLGTTRPSSRYDNWLLDIRNSVPTASIYRRGFTPLLESAFNKGFVLNRDPVIKLKASGDWYDEIAGRVMLLKGLLRKVPQWPTWYVSEQFVVGCAEADGKVLAWVGLGNVGRVVLFDANTLEPSTKLETPYDLLVHGLAMSWFLDSSLLLDRQIETISLINDVYRPTKNFSSFVSRQRRFSDEIPRACEVSGHLRLLPRYMNPSHSQRAMAPSYLQARMESQHTYVRPHSRNGEALKLELAEHLSRYSATAAAVALIGVV